MRFTPNMMLGALLLVAGCGEESGGEGERAAWTVMVYMAADNDLLPFALDDLEEMASLGGLAEAELVLQIDLPGETGDVEVGGLTLRASATRLRLGAEGLERLDELGEVNMGGAGTLADFVGWAAERYPAERYALVIWDHGAAWQGVATDDSAGDLLTAADLTAAMGQWPALGGPERLDLLAFDACLMATVEVLAAVRGGAEIVLGSEDLVPGHGLDYRALGLLDIAPGMGGAALGDRLMQGFAAQSASEGAPRRATLSLVELARVDGLLEALETLAQGVVRTLATEDAEALAVARALSATALTAHLEGTRGKMVDLAYLLDALAAEAPALQAEVRAVQDAWRGAQMARLAGGGARQLGGVSIYLHRAADPTYAEVAATPTWPVLLDAWAAFAQAAERRPLPAFVEPEPAVEADEGGGLRVAAALRDAEQVVGATFQVGRPAEHGGEPGFEVLLERPADVGGSEVSAFWPRDGYALFQGEREGLVAWYARESGVAADAVVPVLLRAADGDGAARPGHVQVSGSVERDAAEAVVYAGDEGGVAELAPDAPVTIEPAVRFEPDEGDPRLVPLRPVRAYDPSRPLRFARIFLEPGQTLTLRLVVVDALGRTVTTERAWTL